MKMMNKFCALMLSVALCAGMAAPAFAYGGEPVEEVEQPVLTSTTDEEDVVTVTDEETGALTPEGNLTMVDDYHTSYSDGSGQQFITLVSKSGNTFYLVIDRNDKGENTVHFMNLVDEADLLSLMEDEDADAYTAEKEAAAQAEQERKQAEEDAKKAAEEAEASGSAEQTGGNKVTKYAATFLGVLALVGLVAGGGIYTFMKQKQKKQAEKSRQKKKPLTPMQTTLRTRATLKSLWRMSRRRPARRITQKNNSIGGICRRTYCNPKQIGGILIAKLIVAEKPSVAMSYAKVLGATNHQDGYLEGNGYLVSWCVGHLVELAPPNVYDDKYVKWSIADLPILPQKWQYLVSASTKKQFGILQKLMHRPDVDSIVNSCDAGREGELIFRLVYQQAGCKKPFSRLWLSSMEETAIREGFQKLKPSTEYDALYNAALCRERADWMVGINASRLFSCLYGQPLAVGRVMTPVLAMTVVREAAIAAFVPEKFYTVALTLADGGTASSKRFAQKADAELLLSKCRKEGRVTVQKMERKEKSESPPQLYDLTALQRDANRLLGFTAQQTLDYAQSLYEKRLITYPRTDSRFLTEDMAASLPGLVTDTGRAFAVEEPFPIHVQQVINGSKVTDHHALLPTKSMANADLAALPAGERNVLRLIAARLLCAVVEPYCYAETTLTTICAGEEFTAKGKVVLSEGWKAVERKMLGELLGKQKEPAVLPDVQEQSRCSVSGAELKEGQTSPSKHFTEDLLLHAMETASADSMPEGVERQGIGTPATRAATIEKLVQKGFLERKGTKKTKVLLPTDKGKALITVMPEEIQSPEMTADWETKLLQIERGEMEPSEFMTEINTMITELVKNTEMKKGANALMKNKIIGVCPNCGANVVEREKGWFCENRECRFVLWKDNAFFKRLGKHLDAHVADKLLRDGRVRLKDCKSAKGKTYNAAVLLSCEADGRSKFSLEFEGGC